MGFPTHNPFIDRNGGLEISKLEWMHISCVTVAQKYHPWRWRLHRENSCSKTKKWIWNWNWNYYLQTMIISSWLLTKKKNTNCHIVTNNFFTIFNGCFPCSMIFCHFFPSSSKKKTTPWWLQPLPSTTSTGTWAATSSGRSGHRRAQQTFMTSWQLRRGWLGGGRFSATKWGKKLPFQQNQKGWSYTEYKL